MTDWTPSEDYYLAEHWGPDGPSLAQIGMHLDRSKNAVVGRARRLKLPKRPSPIRAKGESKPPRPKSPMAGEATLPCPPCLRGAPAPPQHRQWVPTVHPCCWPIGTPRTRTFRYCDEPAEPGRPYCPTHLKLAYVNVKRRDRREDAD